MNDETKMSMQETSHCRKSFLIRYQVVKAKGYHQIYKGIMLQFQDNVRVLDLCKSISENATTSEDGTDALVNTAFKWDTLSVVSESYRDFIDLLTIERGSYENFHDFKYWFSAQVYILELLILNTRGYVATSNQARIRMRCATNAMRMLVFGWDSKI